MASFLDAVAAEKLSGLTPKVFMSITTLMKSSDEEGRTVYLCTPGLQTPTGRIILEWSDSTYSLSRHYATPDEREKLLDVRYGQFSIEFKVEGMAIFPHSSSKEVAKEQERAGPLVRCHVEAMMALDRIGTLHNFIEIVWY